MKRVLDRSETVLKSVGCGEERRARSIQDSVISIKVDLGAAFNLGHIVNIDGKEGRLRKTRLRNPFINGKWLREDVLCLHLLDPVSQVAGKPVAIGGGYKMPESLPKKVM